MEINLVEELRWRGMLHDMTPETETQFTKEMTGVYVGFDPTASSLHIGNLATIMLLVQAQRAGHKPFALVGGATGMVGDPSGKSAERSFLDEDTLRKNQEGIRKQLAQFLDFDCGENAAELVNNYDWFKEIGFLQFLREAGKFLTVNYMMAKDSVKNRLETGISFTEFSYQLLQGYDFYHLHKSRNVKVQMGGSDQWGNITTGTELIRRKNQDSGSDEKAYALTCPLVTKADGKKFGKSESGNVWLDAEMTTPYEFYQFWLNVEDTEIGRLLRVFTVLNKDTIEGYETEFANNPNALKRILAEEVTRTVHGQEALAKAIKASQILFGKATTQTLEELDERTLLSVLKDVPQTEITQANFEETSDILELLTSLTKNLIFKSKSEARRQIKGGGVRINKEKVTEKHQIQDFKLLHKKYLLAQNGKKKYYLLKIL